MRKLAADIIFPITSKPVTGKVLLVSETGKIIGLQDEKDFPDSEIERYTGALVPGFINAHCHIELSHLKNKFSEKTGLVNFLINVTRQREATNEEIVSAMQKAENEMIQNGIVAVGDISNNAFSFTLKSNRKIYYHTFIELLSIDADAAPKIFEAGLQLTGKARSYGIHTSLAAHAPYTMSEKLLNMITKYCYENGKPTSFHLLESADENKFISSGKGKFKELYKTLHIDLHYYPAKKNSVETFLPCMRKEVRTLLVHNTYATYYDIEYAEGLHTNLFWCLCPNANLFIEDRLSDIPLIAANVEYICIGTDSLASNHRLSILDELKTIQKHYPEILLNDLFRWSSLYGAKFLGIEDAYGSFDIGKTPGINLLSNIHQQQNNLADSAVTKII